MTDKSKAFDVDLSEDGLEDDDWSDFMKAGRANDRPKPKTPEKTKSRRGRKKKAISDETKSTTVYLQEDLIATMKMHCIRWAKESKGAENREQLNNSALIRAVIEGLEPFLDELKGIENEQHLLEEIQKLVKR